MCRDRRDAWPGREDAARFSGSAPLIAISSSLGRVLRIERNNPMASGLAELFAAQAVDKIAAPDLAARLESSINPDEFKP